MSARVKLDRGAIDRIIDRNVRAGAEAAARFMADEMRQATTSRRIEAQIGHESGRDALGWYARAGMPRGTQHSPAFFWYWHEYQTGQGPPGRPFLRQALFNNTRRVARMLLGGGR